MSIFSLCKHFRQPDINMIKAFQKEKGWWVGKKKRIMVEIFRLFIKTIHSINLRSLMSIMYKKHELNIQADHNQIPQRCGQE